MSVLVARDLTLIDGQLEARSAAMNWPIYNMKSSFIGSMHIA
jgi:hypothetical protein